MSHNYATLREDSPFFPLFPRGLVPIKNILLPNQAECIGDGVQDVYMVDLTKLTDYQFDRLARMVIEQCQPGIPIETAKAEMLERGLPLRAKHVQSTSSDVPFFYERDPRTPAGTAGSMDRARLALFSGEASRHPQHPGESLCFQKRFHFRLHDTHQGGSAMIGPGKYDEILTVARQLAQAQAGILIIFDGEFGNGFSAQLPAEKIESVAKVLREIATDIEQDVRHQSLVAAVRGTSQQ